MATPPLGSHTETYTQSKPCTAPVQRERSIHRAEKLNTKGGESQPLRVCISRQGPPRKSAVHQPGGGGGGGTENKDVCVLPRVLRLPTAKRTAGRRASASQARGPSGRHLAGPVALPRHRRAVTARTLPSPPRTKRAGWRQPRPVSACVQRGKRRGGGEGAANGDICLGAAALPGTHSAGGPETARKAGGGEGRREKMEEGGIQDGRLAFTGAGQRRRGCGSALYDGRRARQPRNGWRRRRGRSQSFFSGPEGRPGGGLPLEWPELPAEERASEPPPPPVPFAYA